MSDSTSPTTDRRGFVGAVAALGAGVALGANTRVQRLFVAQQPTGAPVATSDAWLEHLKGRHRQLFDVPEPEGGTALRHVRNYLDAWRDAYGVVERDVSVVVTLYARDRKSTRLNSSHLVISYAVFCLKKKKKKGPQVC